MGRQRSTEHMEVGQPKHIIIPDTGPIVREPEEIIPVETAAINKDYADALQFNEQVLTIVIQPSGEENAPMVIPVWNNGEPMWIKVGVQTNIKRKFVEDLLRAKPISVQTMHEEEGSRVVNNRVLRSARSKYPLTIIHDPSPKGYEWMARVMAEL